MKIVIIFAIILQDIQLDANVANAGVLLLVNIMENRVIAIKIANTRQSIQITYVKHQNIVVSQYHGLEECEIRGSEFRVLENIVVLDEFLISIHQVHDAVLRSHIVQCFIVRNGIDLRLQVHLQKR